MIADKTGDKPSAFGHAITEMTMDRVTFGIEQCEDIIECMDRLLINIAGMLKELKSKSEAAGHAPEIVMDGIDAIVEALERRGHLIVSRMIQNTELDDE